MNIENVELVAQAVERSESFFQREWADTCGTPFCIAGHAAFLSLTKNERLRGKNVLDSERVYVCSISDRAQLFLGVDSQFLEETGLFRTSPVIFWPEPFCTRWEESPSIEDLKESRNIRRQIAADYIRYLIRENQEQAA